ncbi:peptidoglycan-associated lipoprotein Pal [Thiohalobacter sp.]|uniref:peptidoglycan-associated lipoprotein Pal n=1 Tax=Thiohalobacter sp. TaxID=2025948 RepID=UPI002617DC30|nr:peptidoglycan-associated lipoprotein Pal [Thiohalobacter sp.]
MNNTMRFLMVLALGVLLGGCGSLGTRSGQDQGPAVVEDQGQPAGTDSGMAGGAESRGLGTGDTFSGMALDDPASPLAQRTIYFEFDSSEVRPEDRAVLEAHARYLATHPEVTVTLEGHADERGSREYNIGLGDRRAQAVRRLLEFQGASPQQLRTVSYGEEKPVDPGHDETAWARNRRVEIVYPER